MQSYSPKMLREVDLIAMASMGAENDGWQSM
jgi:hypothetical protein